MKPNAKLVALIAVIIFIADQVTKFAVMQWLGLGGWWSPFSNWSELLTIVVGKNTGIACGYFAQSNVLFSFAPFVVLAIVLWFYRQQAQPGWLLSLGTGLIIGGAFGNLADRLRLGYVVDFVQVLRWPVFNVADAAVSTAVVLLLFWSLREDSVKQTNAEGTASGAGISWKIVLSFAALLGILALIGVVVCVIIPENFLR